MCALRLRYFHVKLIRRLSSLPEYTEKPEYPPIADLSLDALKRRKAEVWHSKIKHLDIVEEKLMEVNMPRYYGWRCIGLYEGMVPYGSLQFAQYITRTRIVDQRRLPEFYQTSGIIDLCAPILEHIKHPIKEAIALEYAVERSQSETKGNEDNLNDLGEAIIHQINRVVLNSLSTDFLHLQSCQVDHFPRIESFWIVEGIESSQRCEKKKERTGKDDLDRPVDVKFQYLGRPVAQLRHKFLLPPVLDEPETQNAMDKVPVFRYDPRVVGVDRIQRHVTNIPGFWPGDTSEFPLMSFHSSKYLATRPSSNYDSTEAPYVHAVLASFAWLQALACYKGFSTFQDVTYPMVTQTILSDGQYWSFYVYQLNTMLLHSHSNHASENVKCNLCWGTKKLKLFDKVENGKVVGFNEEVLKILLYFYINVPNLRPGIKLKPYLGLDNRFIADILDKDKRVWLEQHFKHMYTNCPRHLLPYEIYNWEKIYKIKHKTRLMEARRRPFELEQNPFTKRYDDHCPKYVQKADRQYKKNKFEKTYYP